jgi:hypothetical protein
VRFFTYTHQLSKRGTLHLQGYIELHQPIDRATLKRDILQSNSMWCKQSFGSSSQNMAYIEGPTKIQHIPTFVFGKPADEEVTEKVMDQIASMIMANPFLEMIDIAQQFKGACVLNLDKILKFRNFIADSALVARPAWKKYVMVLWGDCGQGKSAEIIAAHGKKNVYHKTVRGGEFWNGYNYEKVVVFEEFDPVQAEKAGMPLNAILELCDSGARRINKKGMDGMMCAAEAFYFTTNSNPVATWWTRPDQARQRAAFWSRAHNEEVIGLGPAGSAIDMRLATRLNAPPLSCINPELLQLARDPEDAKEVEDIEEDEMADYRRIDPEYMGNAYFINSAAQSDDDEEDNDGKYTQ